MSQRQQAVRAFAAEFTEATETIAFSDEDRAPQFQLLPSGGLANRVMIAGTVTNTEDVGDDSEYWKGRVVDPAGDVIMAYAGQYEPDAASTLRALEAPEYVVIVGKPRVIDPDKSDSKFVAVRPESISIVDQDTRDRWAVETAKQTMQRLAMSLAGEPASDPVKRVIDETPHSGNDLFEQAVEAYGEQTVDGVHEATQQALEGFDQEEAQSVGAD